MKDGYFEVGDIIKGLAENGYTVFNETLLEGKVLSTIKHDNPQLCKMRVLIVNHRTESHKGAIGNVINSTGKFKLINKTEEDFWESLEVL